MKKLIMASITAVVVIAVLAGTLIPILDDATAKTDTFTNDGYIRYTEIDATESYTMTWALATQNVVTVNGTEYTIWKSGDGVRNISIVMVPDVGIIRYNHGSLDSSTVTNQMAGLGILSLGNTYTIEFDSGTYTLTNANNTSVTGSYTKAYLPDPNGEYILKNSSDRAYMSSGSTIIADSSLVAMGFTNVTASTNGFQITGTLEDYDVEVFNPAENTFVISDVADDRQAVTGYNDLYTLSKITFNVTDSNDSDVDVDATYSYFLVPYKVTAERTVHFTDGENAIFNAIPVMIIIALLLGVVALVLRSRMD